MMEESDSGNDAAISEYEEWMPQGAPGSADAGQGYSCMRRFMQQRMQQGDRARRRTMQAGDPAGTPAASE